LSRWFRADNSKLIYCVEQVGYIGDVMSWIIKQKWYWIIVLGVSLILLVPLLVAWVLLNLPPLLSLIMTIGIVIAWGVVGGYRDWIKNERKEYGEKKEKPSE
jgi:hypothetical protein